MMEAWSFLPWSPPSLLTPACFRIFTEDQRRHSFCFAKLNIIYRSPFKNERFWIPRKLTRRLASIPFHFTIRQSLAALALTSESSIWAFPALLLNSGWHHKMPQAGRLTQWVFISSQSWGEKFRLFRQGWCLEKGLPWFVDHLIAMYSTTFTLQEGGEDVFDFYSGFRSVAVIKYRTGKEMMEGKGLFQLTAPGPEKSRQWLD